MVSVSWNFIRRKSSPKFCANIPPKLIMKLRSSGGLCARWKTLLWLRTDWEVLFTSFFTHPQPKRHSIFMFHWKQSTQKGKQSPRSFLLLFSRSHFSFLFAPTQRRPIGLCWTSTAVTALQVPLSFTPSLIHAATFSLYLSLLLLFCSLFINSFPFLVGTLTKNQNPRFSLLFGLRNALARSLSLSLALSLSFSLSFFLPL